MVRKKLLIRPPDSRQVNISSAHTTKNSEKYALISITDKTNLVDFAGSLVRLGFQIISTGGTAKVLIDAGIKIVPIQNITGNPESFDGRMKTISFQIESGILYDRTNPVHCKEAKKLGVKKIDLVVSNFYPFEQTINNSGTTINQAVESIDVGGPTMVRAAAKNFKNVLVIVDPGDYTDVINALQSGSVDNTRRQALAAKAFSHLSFYDSQIARYLGREQFPREITLPGFKTLDLRYGENPHQKGTVYFEPNTNSPLKNLQRLTGRELSYVNFADIAAGLESVRVFTDPAAVIIKHNSPCGIALGSSPAESLKRAIAADPESAFGGVIVLNQPLDLKTAQTFASFREENGVLIDIVAAPAITKEAREFIQQVRRTTGVYIFGRIPKRRNNPFHVRFFDGGFLMQNWDEIKDEKGNNWQVAGEIKPTAKQLQQMKIAWKFIARIRSNSVIVVDKDIPMTRGIGSGQTSRVRATKIALEQAGKNTKGAILASDSFFPFDDSVKLAAKSGISAIIQQGGSRNDKASIIAANAAGIAMVFTGERKFWH